MKFFLSLLILIIGISNVFAKSIDTETAKIVARNFLNIPENSNLESVFNSSNISYDQTSGTTNQQVLFHVFNLPSDQGFIIISGDDNIFPVLGYSLSGKFDENSLPSNFRKWIEGYKKEIQYIIENSIKATSEIAEKWEDLIKEPASQNSKMSVGPLITSTWDQGGYYNSSCPGGSVTGCVATAMAYVST